MGIVIKMDGMFPLDREGPKYTGYFALGTVLVGLMFGPHVGWVGVILTIWCATFFRDPDRVTPDQADAIICPADGVIQRITRVDVPKELELGEGQRERISIFMSPFNVHVNRSPIAGKIRKIWYYPGKFFNASLDKASEFNERQAIVVESPNGVKVGFVQIAGLLARRIRCDVREGDALNQGQRVGMIRFGSRVDVYVPEGAKIHVLEGQTMIAGETILATLKA